jgi:hypothetical protein
MCSLIISEYFASLKTAIAVFRSSSSRIYALSAGEQLLKSRRRALLASSGSNCPRKHDFLDYKTLRITPLVSATDLRGYS